MKTNYSAIIKNIYTKIYFYLLQIFDHDFIFNSLSLHSCTDALHSAQVLSSSIITLTVKGLAAPWSSLLEIIFAFFLVSLKRSIDGGFINIT
jgi:hypothetical protein